jgi:hypothetical protein
VSPSGRALPLLAAAALLVFATGSDCESAPGPVPERVFQAELQAPHDSQQTRRTQPVPGTLFWDGTDRQIDIQMVAPVTVDVVVRDAEGEPVPGACIYLDAPGQLGDLGFQTEVSGAAAGEASLTVVPATYDVLVAPDCLVGVSAARLIETVALDGTLPEPLDWGLPETFEVRGRVETIGGGGPVEGALITVFDAERPERHVGVSVLTEANGSFVFEVPQGGYHIQASTDRAGSVPIPPIRVDNQQLPYDEGLTLVIRYPLFQPVTLSGQVFADDITYPHARVLVEGYVPPTPDPGQFTGGFFRAELETNAQGLFEVDVPRGSYTIKAWPSYDDSDCAPQGEDTRFCYGPGVATLDVQSGASLIPVEVRLQAPKNARLEVLDPNNDPMEGAALLLRQLTSPHFAYRRATDDPQGGWFGALPEGIYEVEIIPTVDPDTGVKRYARSRSVLDLSGSDSIVQVYLRRSDTFDGFIFGPGGAGVPGVRVLMFDPADGTLWDETVTNDSDPAGFFRGLLPRP